MAEDIFRLAHQVPVTETISSYVRLHYKNGKYYGLCPFHDDKSIGSFVVFPDVSSKNRGWFQCYACGAKGDNIDFVRKFLHTGYREAAIAIAENAGLISRSDADALRQNTKDTSDIVLLRKEVNQSPSVLAQKHNPEHLDRVYRCFAAASKPLTPAIQEILLNSRKIPESSLGKYFLFPVRDELPVFWRKFEKNISEEFQITDPYVIGDILIGVPGFYVRENNRVAFPTSKERRIGIMIFDRSGRVSGIQTRAADSLDGAAHSKQEKDSRYRFLSSGFANGTKGSGGKLGCSCNFIEDVLFPKKGTWNRAVAVTEGRFKAETLASLGFLVVNMHGISNWKAAGKTALELAETVRAKQFVLCYDREQNENVFQSAANMYDQLSQVLLTEFAVWDPALGKGIDDVINAGYISEISRVPAKEYFSLSKAA